MMSRYVLTTLLFVACHSNPAFAAIGCTLSNPAQDIKYLYPEMTSYKEENREFPKMANGRELFAKLKDRLGSDLDPIYESFDTPFTVYSVFKDAELIGFVHGVNVPGRGGVIQVFLSVDPKTGAIRNFFFQRLESPAAAALRKKEFREQFKGLSLVELYKHDYFQVADPSNPTDKLAKISVPSLDEAGRTDYDASLRGLRKNLILLDIFVFGERSEPYFVKSQESLKQLNEKRQGRE